MIRTVVALLTFASFWLVSAGCGGPEQAKEPRFTLCGDMNQPDQYCPDWKDQCVPAYGCLSSFKSKRNCTWIEDHNEQANDDEVVLVVASGRVSSVDAVHNNDLVGLAAMSTFRVLRFFEGDEAMREVFGAVATAGYNDTGYGDYGELGGIITRRVTGIAKHVLSDTTCIFTIYDNNGGQLFQGFNRIRIPMKDIQNIMASVAEAVKPTNPEIQKLKPAMKQKAATLYQRLESRYLGTGTPTIPGSDGGADTTGE